MADTTPAALPPADNVRGAKWMIGSTICFAISTVAIKKVAGDMPIAVIIFFRCFVGFLLFLPYVFVKGVGVYRTKRPGAHVFRLVMSIISLVGGYYALSKIPIATVVALSYTRPLFMIV